MNAGQEIPTDAKAQVRAKLEELRREHERLKDKSPEERSAGMQAKHDELLSWAEQNNIPPDLLPASRPNRADET